MSEHIYYVYVKKQVPDVAPHMRAWCYDQCEGMFTHHYVSWQLEGWYFTNESDAVNFTLTWSDMVDQDP
jgi:hypothetical protein